MAPAGAEGRIAADGSLLLLRKGRAKVNVLKPHLRVTIQTLLIARQSSWHVRVNQLDKGSRGIPIMRPLIDADKH
jgi:hypothetical protein